MRQKKARRAITSAIDMHTRRALTRVRLANHPMPAVLFEEDFQALMRAGLGQNWTANHNGHGQAYVRAWDSRRTNLETIARLIMRAKKGQRVKYADGDTLNLRRTNLEVW